ncbi:hypothetical protein [Pantoea sp. 18069]|uniref:hypothetical protein n=1 Tax=Pantoea sp. 18069 TaxID=2681415 RepID=UPI00135BAAE6|nr:hypothetical protein [Pantoea sp. 18069]
MNKLSESCAATRDLARSARAHGALFLAGVASPHEEWMSLVWGPRFDREHALRLLASRPAGAAAALPEVMAAADRFDALAMEAKRRVRRLILRHEQRASMRTV